MLFFLFHRLLPFEPGNVASYIIVFDFVCQEQAGSWLSNDSFAAKWLSTVACELSPAKKIVIEGE
jgi:hypothetical protein